MRPHKIHPSPNPEPYPLGISADKSIGVHEGSWAILQVTECVWYGWQRVAERCDDETTDQAL